METIYKLEPHRTMHLQGVDRYGAMASLWGTSATGFSLSGVFRDMADFAVLTLWDADDYFGHYQSSKYLPDFDFSNMILTFDVAMSGIQPLDSPAFQWIPWRSLSYVRANGEPGTIDLAAHITPIGSAARAASATVTIADSAAGPGDRVTLWYQNIAFDFTIPGGLGSSAAFFWQAVGTTASVGGYTYTVTAPGGETGATIAAGIAALASGDANVTYGASSNSVTFVSRVNTGGTQVIVGYTLWLITDPPATWIANYLAALVNAFVWTGYALPLSATAAAGVITISCGVACADGNSLTVYATVSGNVTASPAIAPLTGGASAGSWSVSVDFSALGLTALRKLWLTIAPELQDAAAAYADTEWTYTVTSWAVTDPSTVRALKIAGAGSVRADSRDAGVSYSGSSWAEEASNQPGGTGWFFRGYAHRMSTPGDSVTIRYSCGSTHNLYVGTSLYLDRGIVSAVVDGGVPVYVDGFYNQATEPVVTRRLAASSVAAGTHTVIFTLQSGNHAATGAWDSNSSGHYFYFDYLEAAVASDVPDPAVTYPALMPATDYDTDHGYRLSPQRLIWMLGKLGFAGALDHYLGVFWWNQRKRVGGTFPSATVTFAGTWAGGDTAFLAISGSSIGKSVFPADTPLTIAAHFAYFINSAFTGVRATVSGAVLTITNRTPEFAFTLTDSKSSTAGTVSLGGSLSGGAEGSWVIDDTITPVINRAVTDWHTDFWAAVHAAGLTGVASFSMELVNPPTGYAQKFPDGTAVATDTGFGGLSSTQCTFNATMLAYQKQAFREMAGMMNAAGLTPWLQFGEFLWWFFARTQGNIIGYASYTAPISIGTTVAHNLTTGQKVYQDGVQGNPAANGIFTVTVVDPTHYTLDGSSGNGTYTGGGYVAGGGMAFYDPDTAAAAVTALGRALATFSFPADDPSVNAHADANFLRELIYAHAAAIATFVKATYSGAKFEALWPYDVNYPTLTAISRLGGQLNRYVNLPSQWQTKSGSGLDRFKMEALAFGSSERNFDYAKQAIQFPGTSPLTWAEADSAYLIPWFNGGCAWPLEYLFTRNNGFPLVNFWAFDHLCLLGWPLPMPGNKASAQVY